jgi:hypothetical protein
MKNLNLKKHFFKIVLLIIGIYWAYDYFDNQNKIKSLDFATKANQLRKSLKIPLIDEHMSSKNGYRWESWSEKPNKNEILHAWKNITPSESENLLLNHEFDAYRKLNSNGRIMQFNIISEITGDSVSVRSGKFFFFDSEPRSEMNLTEKEIDSISRNWNLNYLTKK